MEKMTKVEKADRIYEFAKYMVELSWRCHKAFKADGNQKMADTNLTQMCEWTTVVSMFEDEEFLITMSDICK